MSFEWNQLNNVVMTGNYNEYATYSVAMGKVTAIRYHNSGNMLITFGKEVLQQVPTEDHSRIEQKVKETVTNHIHNTAQRILNPFAPQTNQPVKSFFKKIIKKEDTKNIHTDKRKSPSSNTNITLVKKQKITQDNTIAELEKGITITSNVMEKLNQWMDKIVEEGPTGNYNGAIDTWFASSNRVFKLTGEPKLIFKVNESFTSNSVIEQRFKNMVTVKETCLKEGLDKLVVPHAKKFKIDTFKNSYTVIAEECLDLLSTEDSLEKRDQVQLNLYRKHSENLTDAIRQLACLVFHTGLSDLYPKNVRVMQDTAHIGLVDLDTFVKRHQKVIPFRH